MLGSSHHSLMCKIHLIHFGKSLNCFLDLHLQIRNFNSFDFEDIVDLMKSALVVQLHSLVIEINDCK
jgi:hypothetical protein